MIREKIEKLRRTLDYHNHKYYVENSPEISDREFDIMMRELQELEAAHPEYADPNSPTARVGSDLTTEFQSVEHRFPMLSLGNTYSLDELHEFIGRIEKELGQTEFVCELKFDGTAISLTYEHGALLRAGARGAAGGHGGGGRTHRLQKAVDVGLQIGFVAEIARRVDFVGILLREKSLAGTEERDARQEHEYLFHRSYFLQVRRKG